MSKSAFVTHCDKNYLSRVIALVVSLRATGNNEQIYIFCHDSYSQDKLTELDLNAVTICSLEVLKSSFPDLVIAERNRTPLEFYYCISPFLIKYLLDKKYDCALYIDSDLYFVKDPLPQINNIQAYDLGIVPHRFPEELAHLQKYGTFNVGLLFFRNTVNSLKTLNWWALKCLQSTSTELSEERYADQKYLDKFKDFDASVFEFEEPGHNAAPWNCRKLQTTNDGRYQVNHEDLVYYHFSGLRIFERYAVLGFTPYRQRPNRTLRKFYLNYISVILKIESQLGNPNRVDYRKYKIRDLIFPLKYFDILLIRTKSI